MIKFGCIIAGIYHIKLWIMQHSTSKLASKIIESIYLRTHILSIVKSMYMIVVIPVQHHHSHPYDNSDSIKKCDTVSTLPPIIIV